MLKNVYQEKYTEQIPSWNFLGTVFHS